MNLIKNLCFYLSLTVFSHQAADLKKMFDDILQLPQELQCMILSQCHRHQYKHVHREKQHADNDAEPEYPLLPSSLAGTLERLKDKYQEFNQNTYVAKNIYYVDYNIPKLVIQPDVAGEHLEVNHRCEGDHYHQQSINKQTYCLFDGYNINKTGIILHSKDSKTYVLMISKEMCRCCFHCDHNTATLDGVCSSLALHKDADRVILCTESHVVGHSFMLQLCDFTYKHTNPGCEKTQLTKCASADIPFKCKKIAHLDKGMYVAITDTGDFKIIEHAGKTFKIYNQQHKNITFKNCAVNKDHTNLSQGKFCCALLSDTGDLYIADLWNLSKPTLLYAYTIPDVDLVHNIYYKNDEFSIVYHDLNDPRLITAMDVYTDNHGLRWLRAYTKQ